MNFDSVLHADEVNCFTDLSGSKIFGSEGIYKESWFMQMWDEKCNVIKAKDVHVGINKEKILMCGPVYVSHCRCMQMSRERQDPARLETSASLHVSEDQGKSSQLEVVNHGE